MTLGPGGNDETHMFVSVSVDGQNSIRQALKQAEQVQRCPVFLTSAIQASALSHLDARPEHAASFCTISSHRKWPMVWSFLFGVGVAMLDSVRRPWPQGVYHLHEATATWWLI